MADSLDEFVNLAEQSNNVPLIMIDTVDVLLTNIKNKESFISGWINFLKTAQTKGVNVIFTSRTQEWNSNIEEDDLPITGINLPELLLHQIEPYHVEINGKKYHEEFQQFTRVVQALMPIIIDKRGINPYKNLQIFFVNILLIMV